MMGSANAGGALPRTIPTVIAAATNRFMWFLTAVGDTQRTAQSKAQAWIFGRWRVALRRIGQLGSVSEQASTIDVLDPKKSWRLASTYRRDPVTQTWGGAFRKIPTEDLHQRGGVERPFLIVQATPSRR
jgi:hypothetical protein